MDKHYAREKPLVEALITRLGMAIEQIWNPNGSGRESGVDVAIRLKNGRYIVSGA